MKIANYKYNENNFEYDAYQKMLRRNKASEELTRQEKIAKKDPINISLAYYKAYLNYMHEDNEHMGSFLGYIKHEHEMAKKEIVLCSEKGEESEKFNSIVETLEKAFDFYYKLYDCLKRGEFELKEAIESFENQKFKQDCMNLFSLHMLLSGLTQQDVRIHNVAENYREQVAFPLVEESLRVRNKGLKFKTYQERAENIVKSYTADDQPEA